MNTDSKPGKAFSCGTDWEFFQADNCFGGPTGPVCARDVNEDCPLIAISLCGDETPVAWKRDGFMTTCSEYQTPAQARKVVKDAAQAFRDDTQFDLF